MERYCRGFRDSGSNSDSKVGAPWRHGYGCPGGGGGGGGGGDPQIPGGFSWPPRSYTCSFCRREFKSAQALGGHMNVHRRDRARLRQSPPWDPLPSSNPNPNRKDNPSPKPRTDPVLNLNNPPPSHASSESTRISPAAYTFSSLVSPLARLSSSSSSTASEEPLKAPRAVFGVGELKVFMAEDTGKVLNEAREVARLDLEMAMCRDLKEDLDLELRLGYT